MSEPTIVDLNSLNPKQRAKEFKAAQKEVKSKDLVVKNGAFKKLEDTRYYTEGGCLPFLIASVFPKKVCCIAYPIGRL